MYTSSYGWRARHKREKAEVARTAALGDRGSSCAKTTNWDPTSHPLRYSAKYVYNETVNLPRLFSLNLALVALLAWAAAATDPPQDPNATDRKDLISAVKRLEKKLGFRRTKNFRKESAESAVAYRCYYTGKLELPDSYSGLATRAGNEGRVPRRHAKVRCLLLPHGRERQRQDARLRFFGARVNGTLSGGRAARGFPRE